METKTLAYPGGGDDECGWHPGRLLPEAGQRGTTAPRHTILPFGSVLYASTAVAWTFVMRHLTLATIGVIYAMCMILLLALMGVVVFDEPLHRSEIVGIVLALAALILLARFG